MSQNIPPTGHVEKVGPVVRITLDDLRNGLNDEQKAALRRLPGYEYARQHMLMLALDVQEKGRSE